MKIRIGSVTIGENEKIAVQSMTNTDTRDVEATLRQIDALSDAGADIVRLTVPDNEAADAFGEIKKKTKIPLVADIHFDYRLAIAAAKAGADKIRINPGNIGSAEKVKAVTDVCRERGIPIRIGVNSGSLPKEVKEKYPAPCAEAFVEAAKSHIDILNNFDFDDIVISLKASDVKLTVEAYRKFREKYPYPLHVGVTEAGCEYEGIIKSSIGIGALLLDGIGDTIRVSLTADPVREIKAGRAILNSLGLLPDCPEIVSCPTCGRTKIDIIKIANEVNDKLSSVNKKIKIAVMGCVVNGPGEAADADIGIAGGDGCAVFFKHGKIVKKIREDEIISTLLEEAEKFEGSNT